jgi:transposase
MIAISQMRLDSQTAAYIPKQRAAGKTNKEAIRCLKRHLIRWIWRLMTAPNNISQTACLT